MTRGKRLPSTYKIDVMTADGGRFQFDATSQSMPDEFITALLRLVILYEIPIEDDDEGQVRRMKTAVATFIEAVQAEKESELK